MENVKTLTIQEKIEVVEMAIQESEKSSYCYMCNQLIEAALECDYFDVDENLETFLTHNFSELCELALKHETFKYERHTKFKFTNDVWFHGTIYRDLKINLLKELLQLYKNQLV